MNTSRFSRCIFALLSCLLIFLLAACGETGVNPPSTGSPTSTVNPSKTPLPGSSPTLTPTVTVITAPVPPTQTSCPPAGTVRAAVTAPLALGKDANIVYLVTEYNYTLSTSASTLKRFDVTTGAKTEILKMPGVTFGSPQVSADGQWILFVTSMGQRDELQMVRMDGKGLQTLYCLPAGGIQKALWSTNQQQVLISASAAPNGFTGLYLLNIVNGTIAQVLKPTPVSNPVLGSVFVDAITWLNNTQVYVRFGDYPIVPATKIGLLNTDRGVQTISDLKTVFQQTPGSPHNYSCFDADSSYDASTLFVSLCGGISAPNCSGSCSLGTREGPSTINTERAIGGATNTILSSQTLGIASVRAVTSNTLLLVVHNFSENHTFDPSQNGLWRVASSGSGLTRLTTEANGAVTSLCLFSQNPWSNLSRDGSMYAFQTMTTSYPETDTLAFGQLSGGAPQTLASIAETSTSNTHLELIGWTTM
jgi:eukaryotic-like serine/threonine-protein kinase